MADKDAVKGVESFDKNKLRKTSTAVKANLPSAA
jgi:hypothetical protein